MELNQKHAWSVKVVKKMLEEWTKEHETADVVDKYNLKMGTEESWEHGARTKGRCDEDNKKVDSLMKIRTSVNLSGLKQKVKEACKVERV